LASFGADFNATVSMRVVVTAAIKDTERCARIVAIGCG
jgi:hypothetical protein